jgi:preprotein translocase subunit YajC
MGKFIIGDRVIDQDGFYGKVVGIDKDSVEVDFEEFDDVRWFDESYLRKVGKTHMLLKIKSL